MAEISLARIGDPLDMPQGMSGDAVDPHYDGIRQADDLAALQAMSEEGSCSLELVVISESRPGEFSAGRLEALRRCAPLARVWRLLGSWCEGEARSGRPPAGCLATYWHQWEARLARERARAKAGLPAAWSLPMTSSSDERGLATANHPIERGSGTIAILSRAREAASALADVCRLGGYEILDFGFSILGWTNRPKGHGARERRKAQGARLKDEDENSLEESPGASLHPKSEIQNPKCRAVLWDATPDEIIDPEATGRVRSLAGEAPIVAVVGFPRPDDCRRAAELGIAAVVSKPYLVHDLLWHLARAGRRKTS